MTDRRDPPTEEPGDQRDPLLAARLEVEPLDEITRARLVRTALVAVGETDRSGRRQPAWWLAAAAAVAAVVAVGVGVVARDSGDPRPTASAPSTKERNEDLFSGSAAERPATAPASGLDDFEATNQAKLAAIPSLGRLGEVARESALRRAVANAKAKGTFRPVCPTPDVGVGGVVQAAGTATHDGEPATVFVVEVPGAGRVAAVVVNATCTTALAIPF